MFETLLHMDKAPPREQYSILEICNALKLNRLQLTRRIVRGDGANKPPRDVPRGHLAVVVGEARRRFVVSTDLLNHPVLQQLLNQAYEEYSHANTGPLAIPCDEFLFEDIVHSLRVGTNTNHFSCPSWLSEKGLSC